MQTRQAAHTEGFPITYVGGPPSHMWGLTPVPSVWVVYGDFLLTGAVWKAEPVVGKPTNTGPARSTASVRSMLMACALDRT